MNWKVTYTIFKYFNIFAQNNNSSIHDPEYFIAVMDIWDKILEISFTQPPFLLCLGHLWTAVSQFFKIFVALLLLKKRRQRIDVGELEEENSIVR